MNRSYRNGVSAALLCIGLCAVCVACYAGAQIWPKQHLGGVLNNQKTVPQNDVNEQTPEPFYVLILSGCITVACATIAGGLCGLCGGGKEKPTTEMAAVESGQLKESDKFRSSFRIPQEKGNGDEFVVDDAHGNPLFVKIDDQGKPVVRDLGGNVLNVEVGDDRMVAVYNAEPPSTDRLKPATEPPAYTEKPVDGAAAAAATTAATTTAAAAATEAATTTATTTTTTAADAAAAVPAADAAKQTEGTNLLSQNPQPADAPAPAAAPAPAEAAAAAPAPAEPAAAAPAPAEPAAAPAAPAEPKEAAPEAPTEPATEAPKEGEAAAKPVAVPTAPEAAKEASTTSVASSPGDEETQRIVASMGEDLEEKQKRAAAAEETNSIISGLDDVMNDINAMWK